MSDFLARLPRDADAAGRRVLRAVRATLGHLDALEADPGHPVALDQHHVGHVDRGLGGDDAAGGAGATTLVDDLGVLLDPVDALDDHAVLVTKNADDLALGALVLARDHLDGVALLDVHRLLVRVWHHSTSGASEMIFMNFFSRSSRPTGPKIRVPRGSPSFLRMTSAFSSKRMYEPSARRRSLTVRTMTALTTSPFFTLPPGIASLTVATMTSPIPA